MVLDRLEAEGQPVKELYAVHAWKERVNLGTQRDNVVTKMANLDIKRTNLCIESVFGKKKR